MRGRTRDNTSGSGSIEEQATDRLGAIASAFDDDDLAAGQPDTGQRLNVRTVGYDKEVSALPSIAR